MSASQHENKPPENDNDGQMPEDGSSGDQATEFEPGPSFAGDERPPEYMPQMPAWLQTFAATVGDPNEDDDEEQDAVPESVAEPMAEPADEEPEQASAEQPQAEPVAHDQVEDVTSEDDLSRSGSPEEPDVSPDDSPDLPDWLEQPREQPAAQSARRHEEDYSSSSLISEDDLPDWLKAIGPDESAPAEETEAVPSTELANGSFKVPSVSRAWIPGQELQQVTDGASMFALVANQESQTVLPGVGEASGQARTEASESTAEATSERSGGRRFNLLPILVGVLIVVLVVLAVNFILL